MYTNTHILENTGLLPLETYVELRRTRWLKKLANMGEKRNPSKLLGSWLPYARRNGEPGRPQQTIRHAYVHKYLKKTRIQKLRFLRLDEHS